MNYSEFIAIDIDGTEQWFDGTFVKNPSLFYPVGIYKKGKFETVGVNEYFYKYLIVDKYNNDHATDDEESLNPDFLNDNREIYSLIEVHHLECVIK